MELILNTIIILTCIIIWLVLIILLNRTNDMNQDLVENDNRYNNYNELYLYDDYVIEDPIYYYNVEDDTISSCPGNGTPVY